jgi:uncharacterized surface protein with fasciclin (FAS1) repeats
MKILFKKTNWLLILGFGLFLYTSCKNNDPQPNNEALKSALSDSRFSTFTKLLTDNNLLSAFNPNESYTIFAPTNDAFSKIDINKLTKKEQLKLLNTHIVTKRRFLINEIESGTIQSPYVEIYLSKTSSDVFINGTSKVISPDILASNSVIHAIDKVIIPPTENLLEKLRGNSNFSELVSLISAIDKQFEERFIYTSVFGTTILAPTNTAFEELYKTIPKATLIADKKLLNEVLFFHLISGRLFSMDFQNTKEPVNTFNSMFIITLTPLLSAGFMTPQPDIVITNSFKGQYQVIFDTTSGFKVRGIKSGNANITSVNELATNGVIHAIDRVLLP